MFASLLDTVLAMGLGDAPGPSGGPWSSSDTESRSVTEGNVLTLLVNGHEAIPALLEAIDGAKHHLHIESMLFIGDETGRFIAEHLGRAARRGV